MKKLVFSMVMVFIVCFSLLRVIAVAENMETVGDEWLEEATDYMPAEPDFEESYDSGLDEFYGSDSLPEATDYMPAESDSEEIFSSDENLSYDEAVLPEATDYMPAEPDMEDSSDPYPAESAVVSALPEATDYLPSDPDLEESQLYDEPSATWSSSSETVPEEPFPNEPLLYSETKFAIEASFPDTGFRSFASSYYDSNHDGFLGSDEIAAVTAIRCSGQGIASLEGIGIFTSLRTLDCSDNHLERLDLSRCSGIQTINCRDNSLTELILGEQPELQNLQCENNKLTYLDISACPALEKIFCSGSYRSTDATDSYGDPGEGMLSVDNDISLISNYQIPPHLKYIYNTTAGVRISWEPVSGAEKYRILRKNYSDGTEWRILTDTVSSSWIDTTAISGTAYGYTVRCISSDSSTYTSNYDTDGKTILYIAAPELTGITAMGSSVTVTWKESPGAEGYRIFRRIETGGWKKLADTPFLSYTDSTVIPGTTYSYTVRSTTRDSSLCTSAYDKKGLSISIGSGT